jgi:tetratricopeptide (TPR) repeat protein
MISIRLTRTALALMGSAALCGCLPSGPGQSGEEKEPHFQAGRARVNAMDYTGAIEAFEKALEASPRSAAAHFELGWLFADKDPNPAAAIYHYEQYLKLRPDAENAETIKQHIFRLKQDLAKAVLPLPSTPGVQRELEQLAEDNRRLRDEVEKWRAYYANRGVAPTNPPGGAIPSGGTLPSGGGTQLASGGGDQWSPIPGGRSSSGAAARTHKIQAGETPSAIAKKYGVKLEALMKANPGLNPKRLRVGQLLNIPAP